MLNRTNRTLLATTNRLNLGTRSLDQISSGNNNGSLTLRFAHVAHPVAVRVGVVAYPEAFAIEGGRAFGPLDPSPAAMPSMSGSSSASGQPSPGWLARASKPGCQLARAAKRPGAVGTLAVLDPIRSVDAPPIPPDRRRPRTTLGLRCQPVRSACRAARVVVVPVAAP